MFRLKNLDWCIGLALCVGVVMISQGVKVAHADGAIPSILGSWSGENLRLSDRKGYTSVKKTVHITEQKDRRFRGYFDYGSGPEIERKNFLGIIYPDNETFSWVATDSTGYVHGRIHTMDRISACYIETGQSATVGCADMERVASGVK